MTTEERLERMEGELSETRRSLRWTRWALAIVYVCLAGGAHMISYRTRNVTPEEIRSRQFVVVDESGTPCAWLGASKGGPWLTFVGESGKEQTLLSTDKSGSLVTDQITSRQIAVVDDNGTTSAVLSSWSLVSGDVFGTALTLYDANGKRRARLGVADDQGGTRLEMVGENGEAFWTTPPEK